MFYCHFSWMESAFLPLYITVQRAEPHLIKQRQNYFDLGAEVNHLETDFALLEQSVRVGVAEHCSRLLWEAAGHPSLERRETWPDSAQSDLLKADPALSKGWHKGKRTGWSRWPSDTPSNLNCSMILFWQQVRFLLTNSCTQYLQKYRNPLKGLHFLI